MQSGAQSVAGDGVAVGVVVAGGGAAGEAEQRRVRAGPGRSYRPGRAVLGGGIANVAERPRARDNGEQQRRGRVRDGGGR